MFAPTGLCDKSEFAGYGGWQAGGNLLPIEKEKDKNRWMQEKTCPWRRLPASVESYMSEYKNLVNGLHNTLTST
jgi:hypothetical protein